MALIIDQKSAFVVSVEGFSFLLVTVVTFSKHSMTAFLCSSQTLRGGPARIVDESATRCCRGSDLVCEQSQCFS
jgi:hypothetical protein